LGSESSAATLTFTIGDAPTGTPDIKDGAVITDKIINDAITTPKILNDAVTDAKINSLSANKITAGTIDASVITVTNLDADNITSGTIGADKLSVSTLDAISANLGSITAGDMNIGLGNFTVSSSGVMTATGATISGNLTASSLNVTGATVTGSISAGNVSLDGEPLDNVLSYSETEGVGLLSLAENANIDGDFVVNGNFEATGAQPDLIIGKITTDSSNTIQANAILRSESGSGSFEIQAGTTAKVKLAYDALGGTTLSADGGATGKFKINADGSLALTFDSSQNADFTGQVYAPTLRIGVGAPSSSTATGTAGQIQYDAFYIYVCIATNTWKRASLSSW
jgi:hypothetical protein